MITNREDCVETVHKLAWAFAVRHCDKYISSLGSAHFISYPGPVDRSDARPPCMRTVAGSILGSGNILT